MIGINLKVPDDVHAKLKAKAAIQGKKLYPYIIEVLAKEAKK